MHGASEGHAPTVPLGTQGMALQRSLGGSVSPGCHRSQVPPGEAQPCVWRPGAPCAHLPTEGAAGQGQCHPLTVPGGTQGTSAPSPRGHLGVPTTTVADRSDCGKEKVDERAHPHHVQGLEVALVPSASAATSLRALPQHLGRLWGLQDTGKTPAMPRDKARTRTQT